MPKKYDYGELFIKKVKLCTRGNKIEKLLDESEGSFEIQNNCTHSFELLKNND